MTLEPLNTDAWWLLIHKIDDTLRPIVSMILLINFRASRLPIRLSGVPPIPFIIIVNAYEIVLSIALGIRSQVLFELIATHHLASFETETKLGLDVPVVGGSSVPCHEI